MKLKYRVKQFNSPRLGMDGYIEIEPMDSGNAFLNPDEYNKKAEIESKEDWMVSAGDFLKFWGGHINLDELADFCNKKIQPYVDKVSKLEDVVERVKKDNMNEFDTKVHWISKYNELKEKLRKLIL